MAEFPKLGLQQCMVSGIVHQSNVVLEFRVEPDGEHAFVERNRVGLE